MTHHQEDKKITLSKEMLAEEMKKIDAGLEDEYQKTMY